MSWLSRFLSVEPFQIAAPLTLPERVAISPVPTRTLDTSLLPIADQIARATRQAATRPWRSASIDEALGVPAIQRAVVLISNTIGRLPMEAWRNGSLMTDPPRVAIRPNPYQTPRDFYRETGWSMATRGEAIWWIASRDVANIPAALVVVPAHEVTVEENPQNRMQPIVRWQSTATVVTSTWYSPANQAGQFVLIPYAKEPLALRGKGPLQMARAAVSVSVEAQEWAANFYADGGNGGTLIKVAGMLGQTDDEVTDPDTLVTTQESEADRVRAQWVGKPNNVPRVIDEGIESVSQIDTNTQGAQMLDAREHQNGDAARLFGIPGALMEYAQSGTSLTYQTVVDVWREFQESCLTPNYLSPIEQAMSDLLTRSTTARFSLKDLLRADPKTRAEIYTALVPLGIMTAAQAAQDEGYLPGGRQYAPVPPSQPNAVPTVLSAISEAPRCPNCSKLLGRRLTPPYEVDCPRCKARVVA
jgi:HK97 family phage portal protein